MDLDGDLDLFVVRAPSLGQLQDPPDTLLLNDGDGNFSIDPDFVDADSEGAPTGMVWADLNGDHSPEALVFEGEFDENFSGPVHVWSRPTTNGWIEIQPLDPDGSRSLSALVTVETGAHLQRRLSSPAPHFAFNGTQSSTFGLGSAPYADRVTVHWPSGATSELTNVRAGTSLQLKEPVLGSLASATR